MLSENWSGLTVLDSKFYPKMFGHADKRAYCEYVTIAERANEIKVPTFAVGSEDDQICGHMFAPLKAAQSSDSQLCLGITKHGAHVNHMTGHLWPKSWYTKPVLEWFEFLEARNTFTKKYN